MSPEARAPSGTMPCSLRNGAGARVLATVSGEAKAAHALAGGADAVVNYRQEDVVARVRELTGGEGVDRIVEVDFGGNLAISMGLLKRNGTVAIYASDGNARPEIDVRALMGLNATLHFVVLNSIPLEARRQAQRDVTRWAAGGAGLFPVAARFPLDGIVAAHELVESLDKLGTSRRRALTERGSHMDLPCTLADLIAAHPGDRVALAAPGRASLTFGALGKLADETVSSLNAFGIGRKDRVAVMLPNGPEMAAAFLAVGAGAAVAPLNPAYREDEFHFYLDDLSAKALIVSEEEDGPAVDAAARSGVPVLRLVGDRDRPAGSFSLLAEGTGGESTPVKGYAGAADTALVLHTSGTTSRPKIVPLSQANICASAEHIVQTLRLEPADRSMNIMPLFHIHGLIANVLAPMRAGVSVYCTPGFDAFRVFEWFADARPTWYSAVPTMHQAILARARRNTEIADALQLRFVRSSSSSLPPQVMRELETLFRCPVIESYGMTEAAHQMASNPLPPAERRAGSVGVAAGPDIAVMDEAGRLLPAGETGEVIIRGPNVMAAYENNPEANESAFADGWFRTGDQAPGGCCGLSDDYRPAQGDHQPGRRKDFSARGGRGPDGPCRGPAGRDIRRAAPDAGRRGGRRGGPGRGRGGERPGPQGVRQHPAGRLQGAAPDRVRGRDSQGRDGQAPAHRARRETRPRSVKIAIFGAGAIGCHLAALLARQGDADIGLIARGPHLAAMQTSGLRFLSGGEDFTLPVAASEDPAAFGVQDIVIVTLKAHQAPGAVEAMRPAAGGRARRWSSR